MKTIGFACIWFLAGLVLVSLPHDGNSIGVAMFVGLIFWLPAIGIFLFGLIAILLSPGRRSLPTDASTHVEQHMPAGTCPNCDVQIPVAAAECPHCRAQFGSDSAWAIKRQSPVTRSKL
jgi:hypothetical protein